MPELWYIKHPNAPRCCFTTIAAAQEAARGLAGVAYICRVSTTLLLQNPVHAGDLTATA